MPAPYRTLPRRSRGFLPAARLVEERIRAAGESRGFAVSRLLTHWTEIVGQDVAEMARPVRIAYRRDGLGAALTLLTNGAAAPLVQMQLPRIREKVNACYGYNAISRILLTQTAPEGFAEPQTPFRPPAAAPDPHLDASAAKAADGVCDPELRSALEALARNVLTRNQTRKGP